MTSLDQSASLRLRLKSATKDLHAQVESHLDLDGAVRSRSDYRFILETLWGFYHPIENALERIDWKGIDISIERRRKLHWLEADLVSVGSSPNAAESRGECAFIPTLDDFADGLGALYVLEGSTLGGQLILRTLSPRLAISSRDGGRFFASYGNDTSAMWRSYLTVIERFSRSADIAASIERRAYDTFLAFDRWFVDSKSRTSACRGSAKQDSAIQPREEHHVP
jgi:heme oxygenase